VPSLEETARQLLALTREAGTPAAAAARELVAAHLRALDYEVVTQTFSFSPASLRAFPLFGDGLGLLALILLPLLGSPDVPPWSGLVTWLGGLSLLAVAAGGIGLGWVPLGEPQREDANLIATKPGGRPRRWVMAHLDSKAQGHSMAGRLVAVWITVLAIAALSGCVLVRLAGALHPVWAGLGCATALMAGFLARKGRLHGRSQGARDNGSGVVGLLAAAEASAPDIGFLITGAEEFGLVGARVFARHHPNVQGSEVVNLDTLDDEGPLYLVCHNIAGEQLSRMVDSRLASLGISIRKRRLPVGIFVDSAPLARAGAASITVGRLTWNTLRRIHTPADTPEGLSFRTAKAVGQALALN
jgi:peptidase M28-like protein